MERITSTTRCVECNVSRRRVLQRKVLHLGELNTTQLDRWQRAIEVVCESGERKQMRLLSDRENRSARGGRSG